MGGVIGRRELDIVGAARFEAECKLSLNNKYAWFSMLTTLHFNELDVT